LAMLGLSTQLAKPRPHYLSPLDAFSVLTVVFQVTVLRGSLV
jgi:hypothetical protein